MVECTNWQCLCTTNSAEANELWQASTADVSVGIPTVINAASLPRCNKVPCMLTELETEEQCTSLTARSNDEYSPEREVVELLGSSEDGSTGAPSVIKLRCGKGQMYDLHNDDDEDEEMNEDTVLSDWDQWCILPDGSRCYGQFPHGGGGQVWLDGRKYKGQFCNGLFDGQGRMTWKGVDGTSVYMGQYTKGFKNGYGKYTWADGREYAGEWMMGSRWGKAVCRDAHGECRSGVWPDDTICEWFERKTDKESTQPLAEAAVWCNPESFSL